jgi:hypothetical protein
MKSGMVLVTVEIWGWSQALLLISGTRNPQLRAYLVIRTSLMLPRNVRLLPAYLYPNYDTNDIRSKPRRRDKPLSQRFIMKADRSSSTHPDINEFTISCLE